MSVITATSYEMDKLWKVSVRADSITSVTLDGKSLTYKFSKGICTFDVPKTVKVRTVVINEIKVMKFDPLENLTDKRGFLDRDKVKKFQKDNGVTDTPGVVDVPKGDVLLKEASVVKYSLFLPGRLGEYGKPEDYEGANYGIWISIEDLIPFDDHTLDYKIYDLSNGESFDGKFWIASWSGTGDGHVDIYAPFMGDDTEQIGGIFKFRVLIKLQRPLNSVINQLKYKDEDYEKTYYADLEVDM